MVGVPASLTRAISISELLNILMICEDASCSLCSCNDLHFLSQFINFNNLLVFLVSSAKI